MYKTKKKIDDYAQGLWSETDYICLEEEEEEEEEEDSPKLRIVYQYKDSRTTLKRSKIKERVIETASNIIGDIKIKVKNY